MNHKLQDGKPQFEPSSDRYFEADRFSEEEPSSLAGEYYHSLMRHKLLIASVALLCAAAGLLVHLTTQPTYRTRTSLHVQSLNADFLNLRSTDPTAATPSDTMVQTEIKLLESDSLLDRVEARLNLEPHPAFIERNDLLSRLERALHLGHTGRISYDDLLDETKAGVKVKPLGLTQLIEVTCDSWDAKFAARFCNTLNSEFQAADLDNRGEEAKRTSDWLVKQASDIRAKAEESEKQLIAAAGGNGLILSEQGNGVGEDGLRQMQSELVRAQATRMEKEAELASQQQMKSPISGGSSTYASDKAKLADLESQVAALVPPLTEANPRVMHLRSAIRQVKEGLANEGQESNERLQGEFEAAKHREALLSLAYQAQAGRVSSDLTKSSEVDLLRRQVQGEQQLYQTLIQHAKEAGFSAAMPASTISVVDPAKSPRLPTYPRQLTSVGTGFLLGGALGVLLAFFKDRSKRVLRLPGDSERFIHTEELGVIPSPLAAFALRGPRIPTFASVAQPRGLLTSGKDHPSLHTARWEDDLSLVAEAYRNTVLSIMTSGSASQARTLVVSSPSAGDGKTTVVSNLAVALSKTRLKVVVIDGDLRKPNLHKIFKVDNDRGLRQVLSGALRQGRLRLEDVCQASSFRNLSVIPAGYGREAVVELLHSGELKALIQLLEGQFDVVLIDSPPMLHMVDARILASEARGTILVFRSGVTTREDAAAARTMLARSNMPLVGSILNDFDPSSAGRSGYYASYSNYQKGSQEEVRVGAEL